MWSAILLRQTRRNARSISTNIVRWISFSPVHHKEENLQEAYADLIRYFSSTRDLEYARKLHGRIVERGFGKDRYLLNLVTEMYGKCGSYDEAKQLFDKITPKDQATWAAMVVSCCETDHFDEGLYYYSHMLSEGWLPTYQTLHTAIACAESLPQARKLHDQVVNSGYSVDMPIMTGVLNMYRRCDRFDMAREVFDSVKQKDIYFWTSMLSAYSHTPEEALEGLRIYWRMELEGIRPDRVTFISWIASSSNVGCACYAKLVHERVAAHGLDKDVVVASAMLHMHGRCGNLQEARKLFDSMPQMNTVTWNSMIASYSFYNHSQEAIQLFMRMGNEGYVPDHVTYACVLDACADMTALETGRAAHNRVKEVGLESDLVILSALLNLYGKCGKPEEAKVVFDASYRNVSCWNAMITAYAQNVRFIEATAVFLDMCHQGVKPDDVTFVVMVAACGHAGKLELGRDMFRMFQTDFNAQPTVEHYGCMADMLGRNGKVAEAEELVDNMPFYPDLMSWTALLRACQQKDRKRGLRLAKVALESYPQKSGPYVLLSQMGDEIKALEEDPEYEKKTSKLLLGRDGGFVECLDSPIITACACAVC